MMDQLGVIAVPYEGHYISVQCFNYKDELDNILEKEYINPIKVGSLIAKGDLCLQGNKIISNAKQSWNQIKNVPHASALLLIRHCVNLGAYRLHVYEDGRWVHMSLEMFVDQDYSSTGTILQAS